MIMPALNLDELIATLAAERISVMVTVPAVYSLMLRDNAFASADVSGIRWVGYGGAPIAPSLVRAVKEAFPQATVFNGYGMTEMRSAASVAINSSRLSAGMITDAPPRRAATKSCELQPVTWNSGTEMSVRIPSPRSRGCSRHRIAFSVLVTKASCVVGTPLGWPVVPEV